MQGIYYTHIPETNYVPREYSVAAILLLLFMVLIIIVVILNIISPLSYQLAVCRSVHNCTTHQTNSPNSTYQCSVQCSLVSPSAADQSTTAQHIKPIPPSTYQCSVQCSLVSPSAADS